ncbi:MAG: hypothetical protein A3H88_02740 [Candidatus Blackburnbacteria bacterium RIFCSPLOWO2_02_FULL_44_9]|nr:MAG: hypothetical protein A3H88_02740 [Candidatus Blackburnbacteria bacterium RIFCSPLOWO2_02_FULL_44_9]
MGVRVPRRTKSNSPQRKSFNEKEGRWNVVQKVKTTLALIGKPPYMLISVLLLLVFWLTNSLVSFLSSIASIPLSITKLFTPTPKPTKVKTKKKKPFMSFRRALALFTITLSLSLVFFWARFIFTLPQPGHLTDRNPALTTKIYDRNGQLLYKIYRNQNRTWLPLDQIPNTVVQATIAIEDAEFYTHHGFSTRGIIRSIRRNITRGEKAGGSTITQQLVKNTLLSPEKTFSRKLKEIILAIIVETKLSKDQILEMYLNEVSYGGSAYGIEEASQLYFKKHAQDLNLAESTLLAGLPKAPTTYSPFGATPELTRSRQLEVLSRMTQEHFISSQEAEEAAQVDLEFAVQLTDIKAPHFVMYIKQILAERFGEQMLEEGGLSIYTSLDLATQEMAQKVTHDEVEKIRNLNISNGATLITNPQTGEILAMVGSKDYFDLNIDGNFNVTTALRQPGSAIKPINYSYALETKKYTSASTISDTPVTYTGTSAPYSPRNYDNKYHGNVTLRTALGSSLNIPAVKVLASYGVDKMIQQAQKLGITTWTDPKRYGLSLTLGGGEVRMIDMAVAYGTFANSGQKTELNPILQILDSKGKTIGGNPCSEELIKTSSTSLWPVVYAEQVTPPKNCSQQVLNPGVVFLLTDILRDNVARTPAFGPNSLLVIPNHPEVAVKTGTTQNLRDNWAIGYTEDYVVLAWVGNNDGSSMAYVASGVTGATPIWHNTFQNLLKDKASKDWEKPQGVVKTTICGKTEYFLEGTQTTYPCPKPKPAVTETDRLLDGVSTTSE